MIHKWDYWSGGEANSELNTTLMIINYLYIHYQNNNTIRTHKKGLISHNLFRGIWRLLNSMMLSFWRIGCHNAIYLLFTIVIEWGYNMNSLSAQIIFCSSSSSLSQGSVSTLSSWMSWHSRFPLDSHCSLCSLLSCWHRAQWPHCWLHWLRLLRMSSLDYCIFLALKTFLSLYSILKKETKIRVIA